MLRKGDRVSWNQDGVKFYGVVEKGGRGRISVVKDGGQYVVKGGCRAFCPSAEPLPNANEPNVMQAYSIKGYKEIEGHGDSPTFSATICKNGKAIIHASNDGWGGPNMYQSLTPAGGRALVDEFLKAAEEWVRAATGTTTFEPADLWIDWEMFKRPYGVTAADDLAWVKDLADKKEVSNAV